MKTLMYLSDSLDELEKADHELEERGIPKKNIHVLSEDHAGVEQHDLPPVNDFASRDFVHGGGIGAALGALLAAAVVFIAGESGLAMQVGWIPFLFLAIVLFGFCTWEGGLLGGMQLNHRYRVAEDALHNGRHLLIVDVEDERESRARSLLHRHAHLQPIRVQSKPW